ncbi:MAG: hypothetical protein IT247_02275 [Bacteroidia bacterium]|nr:hypothetical protein [Bacteroidia bacterium]
MKLIIAVIILFVTAASAQNNKAANQSGSVVGVWYESPADSKGNVMVFKTTKHVNVPGVDVIGMEYSKLVLNSNNTCVLDFGKWCSNKVNHLEGSWSSPKGDKILLNFGNNGCNLELKVISLGEDLRVEIKENN